MFLNIYFLLGAFYILKTVREPLILIEGHDFARYAPAPKNSAFPAVRRINIVASARFVQYRCAIAALAARHRLGKIALDVFDILQPHGQSHQAISDTQRRPFLRLQALVSRRCRMGDQAFRITEIVGDID